MNIDNLNNIYRWRKIEKIAKKNLNNLNSEKLNQYWEISKK